VSFLQCQILLSRNVFLNSIKGKTKDGEEVSLKDYKGTEEDFMEAFKSVFDSLNLTIDETGAGNTIQIKGSDGEIIAEIDTNNKNSGDQFIKFLKGYLKNVDGGILKELLSQGVIPKIAKGKTKPKTDENKPDPTLNKTKEDCPGTWDDIMKTCG